MHAQIMSTCLLLCRFCDLNDFPGVIYDHECTGESNFGDPIINNTKDVLFSHWIQDVHAVIDQLTEGPIVLVGCSMGGNENLKTLLVINVQLLRELEPKGGLISISFSL